MTTVIAKWGNSAALRVPKEVLNALSIGIGDAVELKLIDKQLVIAPAKPTLEQLLANITDENKHTELLNDAQGREML